MARRGASSASSLRPRAATCRSVDDPSRLPEAPLVEPLLADRSGYIAGLDAREVGYAVVELGGGRERKGDPIDPAVGVVLAENTKVGNHLEAGEPVLWIHARDAESLAAANRAFMPRSG